MEFGPPSSIDWRKGQKKGNGEEKSLSFFYFHGFWYCSRCWQRGGWGAMMMMRWEGRQSVNGRPRVSQISLSPHFLLSDPFAYRFPDSSVIDSYWQQNLWVGSRPLPSRWWWVLPFFLWHEKGIVSVTQHLFICRLSFSVSSSWCLY